MESVSNLFNSLSNFLPVREVQTTIREIETMNYSTIAGRNFIRFGGLSGGLAVIMSAYGAHAFKPSEEPENDRMKNVFESGNKMHLIHSVALLGMPLTRRPKLIGSMMLSGMTIFCGSCYYQSITGDGRIRWITPYGGFLLILSWFMMIL